MTHLVDIIVLVLLVATVLRGVQQGLLRQLSISVCIIIGLFVVAFFYNKLATLSAHSSIRMIILVLLSAAILLLCYTVSLPLGTWAKRRYKATEASFPTADKIGGALCTVFTTGLVVWIVAALFGPAMPAAVRRQLRDSAALSAVTRYAALPPVFSSAVHLLQPFDAPTAFAGSEPEFSNISSNAPVEQQFAALDAAIEHAKPAVMKIRAWGCGSTSVGSGFLVAPHLIMTNAHVIAGAERIAVQDSANTYSAAAVWFDPKTDDAILTVEATIKATPLVFEAKILGNGSFGAVLGYPDDGKLAVSDATILQLLDATGYDIYSQAKTTRSIYAVRNSVVPGSSGGPLLTISGKVAGMVFGNSTAHDKTGYAIASSQLTQAVQSATEQKQQVGTGSCTGQ